MAGTGTGWTSKDGIFVLKLCKIRIAHRLQVCCAVKAITFYVMSYYRCIHAMDE